MDQCDCYGCTTMRHPCVNDLPQRLTTEPNGAILYVQVKGESEQDEQTERCYQKEPCG
jgi:hypothetical protein